MMPLVNRNVLSLTGAFCVVCADGIPAPSVGSPADRRAVRVRSHADQRTQPGGQTRPQPQCHHDWVVKQGWTRVEVLRSYAGEAGQHQFQRAVRAAIKAAGDKKIIQALERSLAKCAARQAQEGRSRPFGGPFARLKLATATDQTHSASAFPPRLGTDRTRELKEQMLAAGLRCRHRLSVGEITCLREEGAATA
jgi:hypothetical protein